MPRKCAVNDCNSGCNARLHNFPSDLERFDNKFLKL